MGFPGGSVVKNLPANAGDREEEGLIPGSGRSPGRENGNLLLFSCLDNPMDRGTQQATVHGVAESDMTTTKQACNHSYLSVFKLLIFCRSIAD